jgi:multidrug efflux pump subunit AcrA (membrane-fusion protein)
MSRRQSQIRIAAQALVALEAQQQQADVAAQLARIVETRQQALERFQEAAALRAQVQPHLDAIEAIEGVRYYHHNPRSARLEQQADRELVHAEYLAFRLPADVRRDLEVQRETQPTEVDRALFAFQYPAAVAADHPG